MKKKYLAKLLSYALSAAMALTSVVPSYAMENADADVEETSVVTEAEPGADAKTGDEAEEKTEEKQEPADEETEEASEPTPAEGKVDVDKASDKDPEDEISEGEETEGAAVEAEEALEALDAEEEEAEPVELESTDDVTITFSNVGATANANYTAATAGTSSHAYVLDPESKNGMASIAGNDNDDTADVVENQIVWASDNDYIFEIVPEKGYVIDTEKNDPVTIQYEIGDSGAISATKGLTCNYTLSEDKATVRIYSKFFKAYLKDLAKAAAGTESNLTVTINDIAVGDTYSIKVIGTLVAADSDSLKVQYGKDRLSGDDVLNLKEYEDPGNPIGTSTTVSVYTRYGMKDADGESIQGTVTGTCSSNANESDVTGRDLWAFNNSTGEFYIGTDFIKAGYEADKDITIIVGNAGGYTVSQAETETKATLQYQLTGDTSYGTMFNAKKDLEVSIADVPIGATGRKLKEASYIITYDDGTTKTNKKSVTENIIKIPASGELFVTTPSSKNAKTVEVTSIITEDLIKVEGAEGIIDGSFAVTNTDGTSLLESDTVTETGGPLTFKVKGGTVSGNGDSNKDGIYIVEEVSYKVGTATTATSLGCSDNEYYTIPEVDGAVTIIVKTKKTTTKDVIITTKATSGINSVVDKETETINLVDNSKYKVATKDADFDFVITTNAGTKVSAVKYKAAGGSTEVEGIVTIDEEKGIYRLPASAISSVAKIELVIYTSEMVQIKSPDNTKAIVKVGGVKQDSTFYVEKGKEFSFTVEGVDDTITVDEVSYTVNGTSEDGSDEKTSFTISASKMTGSVVIAAKTTERPKASEFKVTFVADLNGSFGWNGTSSINNSSETNNTLYVARTDKVTLTPTITLENGTDVTSNVAENNITYEQSSTKTGTAIVTKIEQTSTAKTAEITGMQVGTEVMKYSFKATAVSGNVVIYSGTLPIEVKNHYKITLNTTDNVKNVKADVDNFAKQKGTDNKGNYAKWQVGDGYRAKINASITNTVTHNTINTALDTTDNIKNIKWTKTGSNFYITKGSETKNNEGSDAMLDTKARSAIVAASSVSSTPGIFNIEITEGVDAEGNPVVYTAKEPISLYAVAGETVVAYPTISIAGGLGTWDNDGVETVTLDAEAMNEATIEYKVYVLKNGTQSTSIMTKALLEEAIENGNAVDVTEDTTFTKEYYLTGDTNETKPEFMTIENEGNVFTASANAAGEKTVTLVVSPNYNNETIAKSTITFNVIKKSATFRVPIELNDGDATIELNDDYLGGKSYTPGSAKAAADNGYLFKVADGATFVLPTEDDLSETSFEDTTRKLVGWNIEAANGAINGADELGSTDNYYMPGQSIIIEGDVTMIHPIWDDRYAISDIYRGVEGDTQTVSNKIYSDTLVNNTGVHNKYVEEEAPDSTISLATRDTVVIGGKAKIGAKIRQARTYATIGTGSIVNQYNNLYPEAGTGNGKVVWKAYDTTLGGHELPETNTAGRSKNTYLDPTALANGVLTGLKKGYSFVYAVYTDEDGREYTSEEFKVTVAEQESTYTIDLSKLPDEIEVGQVVETGEGTGVVMLDENSMTYDSDVATDKDVFTYTIGGDGDLKIVDGNVYRTQPVLTGVKEGTVTVSLEVTDIDGITTRSTESKTITVKPAAVTINVTDKDGKATTDPAVIKINEKLSSLYVTATDAAGSFVSGTFAVKAGNSNISAGPWTLNPTSTNSNVKNLESGAIAKLGTTTFTITFTSGSSVYSKDIELKSYYGVTFENSGVFTTDSSDKAKKIDDLDTKVKVTNKSGAEQDGAYIEKIYDTDIVDKKFSLDLSGYVANYSGTAESIEFIGWCNSGDLKGGEIERNKVIKALTNVAEGNKTLLPVFSDSSVKSIDTSIDEIKIDNAGTYDGTKYVPNYKSVEIFTSPKDSVATVNVKSSVSNTGVTDQFFIWKEGTNVTDATDGDELKLEDGTAGDKDSVRTYDMSLGTIVNKIGTTTLTVSTVGSTATKDITLTIYGRYQEAAQKYRYRNADGRDAESTSVTVNDTKYFFGADGYQILTSGTAYDADGNLVLLKNGKLVTADGKHLSADEEGNDYFTKDGIVQTGFVTVDNVQRYANAKGVLVTYDMATEDRFTEDGEDYGKYTDPDTLTTYVIAKKDNAAEEDKLFEKESAVWTWTKASDGKTYASAKVVFTSTEGKTKDFTVLSTETDTTAAKYMKITPYDGYTEYTVYASFKSKDTTVDATETKYLDAEGNDYTPDTYYAPVVAWDTWPTTVKRTDLQAGVYPTIQYNVTYTKASDGTKVTVEDVTATITSTPAISEITDKTDKVELVATADLSKYFKDAAGKEVAANQKSSYIYLFGTADQSSISEDVSDGKGIMVVDVYDEYDYTGNAIQPVFTVVDLENPNEVLVKGTDYTVSFKNNKKMSVKNSSGEYTKSAEIIVKGKGNYAGQAKSVYFAIVDPMDNKTGDEAALAGASLKLSSETHTYNGDWQYPAYIELKLKGGSFTKYELADGQNSDVPAVITYSNNLNKGTATICLTGSDNKTLKKTFSIKAVDISKAEVDLTVDETADWAVSGAKPGFDLTVNGEKLYEGQDFTVKYSNNKKATTATFTITGKNNYSGTLKNHSAESFTVNKLELKDDMIRAVSAYADAKVSQVKTTVLDPEGAVIPASKYTVKVKEAGSDSALAKSTKLASGKDYVVTVKAKDTAEISGEAEVTVTAAKNLGKAKVTISKGFTKYFTGDEVTVDPEDFTSGMITVKVGSDTLVEGTDFNVTGYTNNIKKGNMTVTINGDGDYSGVKTFKVKISAKPIR